MLADEEKEVEENDKGRRRHSRTRSKKWKGREEICWRVKRRKREEKEVEKND